MNAAQKAIALLRDEMTGDDLRQLPNPDLRRMEAICQHWLAMIAAEHKARICSAKTSEKERCHVRL